MVREGCRSIPNPQTKITKPITKQKHLGIVVYHCLLVLLVHCLLHPSIGPYGYWIAISSGVGAPYWPRLCVLVRAGFCIAY